jgi:hypothetical protein
MTNEVQDSFDESFYLLLRVLFNELGHSNAVWTGTAAVSSTSIGSKMKVAEKQVM